MRKSEAAFHEAYMTHTSTSANYQILASMDVGRRQVEFEGNELVEKAIELGMMLRRTIREHDKLRKWFDIITIGELIPKEHRESGIEGYYSREKGWNDIEKAWEEDEFALDPTKINLFTGRTGIDGDTFKNDYLMDKYSIQVNKTSRNSVLFMTNIGTTRGSVAYLTKVLLEIADDLERRNASMDHAKKKMHLGRIRSLVEEVPPLPDFTSFHRSFLGQPGVPGGNLRAAYFLAYEHTNCEHLKLAECLGHGRRSRTGLRLLRHPVPTRLPRTGAGAVDQPRDHRFPPGHRRERDPRLSGGTRPRPIHRSNAWPTTDRHRHGRDAFARHARYQR